MIINVIIPSRLEYYNNDGKDKLFLQRAIDSIAAQVNVSGASFVISVGLDPNTVFPSIDTKGLAVIFTQARSYSQAAALNAAASAFPKRDYVAFLEDDDEWTSEFSSIAINYLNKFEFISSNQLEIGTNGHIIRVNDFPTPSGWFMRRGTWDMVGSLNEDYKWHLDNEWLGRLSSTGLSRAHLIECSAPIDLAIAAQVRPWLYNVVTLSKTASVLVRHHSPLPLIRRYIHNSSGMAQISTNNDSANLSRIEINRLVSSYGRIPW